MDQPGPFAPSGDVTGLHLPLGVNRMAQEESPVSWGPQQNKNLPAQLFKLLRKLHYSNISKSPLPLTILFANLICYIRTENG